MAALEETFWSEVLRIPFCCNLISRNANIWLQKSKLWTSVRTSITIHPTVAFVRLSIRQQYLPLKRRFNTPQFMFLQQFSSFKTISQQHIPSHRPTTRPFLLNNLWEDRRSVLMCLGTRMHTCFYWCLCLPLKLIPTSH